MVAIPEPDLRALGERVLDYLRKHPDAADSLDGVTDWWLAQPGFPVAPEAVREALALLVAEHRIACIDLADGRTLYQSVDKISGSHATLQAHHPKKPT